MRTSAVWGRTASVLAAVHEHERLTVAELARADALASAADRADYVAAHRLVRMVARLAGVTGPLTLAYACPRCGSDEHGRPALHEEPGLHVSLSHTRGAVMAGVSPAPIGVDVQAIRPVDPDGLRPVLDRDEDEWLAARTPDDALVLWCRKEAAVKARGHGVSHMPFVSTVSRGHLRPATGQLTWEDGTGDGYRWCVASELPARTERLA